MATFRVERRASVWFALEVEADTPQEALELAQNEDAIWSDAVELAGTEWGDRDQDYWVDIPLL